MTEQEYHERHRRLDREYDSRVQRAEIHGTDPMLADEWLSRQVDRLDRYYTADPNATADYDAAVQSEKDAGGEIGVDI